MNKSGNESSKQTAKERGTITKKGSIERRKKERKEGWKRKYEKNENQTLVSERKKDRKDRKHLWKKQRKESLKTKQK